MWTAEKRERLKDIYKKYLNDINNTTDEMDSLNFVNYLLEIEAAFNLHLPETIIDRDIFNDFVHTEKKVIELLSE